MKPTFSKLTLFSHITFSVGWIGAVAVFLVLAITGFTSHDILITRSAYIAMQLSTSYVIVPFCLASFFTGLVLALGTKWGLLKHYWIAVKLFLTLSVTIFLLLHLKPISYLAGIAADSSLAQTQEYGLRLKVIAEAGAAILVLLLITSISVYKPWGRIRFGVNNVTGNKRLHDKQGNLEKSKGFYILMGFAVLVIIFIVMHLFGGGMGSHLVN